MIRSIRRLLLLITRERTLTDETLGTYLVEIERILNDRPLTPIVQDANDKLALSPNSLFLLRECDGIVEEGSIGDKYDKRWKQGNHLANVFWKRWLREYLPSLQKHQKCGVLGSEISAAKSWVNSYDVVQVQGGGTIYIGDTNGEMCSPDITADPIFLFLTYSEPVYTSENATRMMAHVLLQTSIDLTVYTPTDGFTSYYKVNAQSEPADPINTFMQQRIIVPQILSTSDSTLRFSNFVQ
ncbi:unnamed protein product [Schistosoma mattheei]|uniref:Uncharacterized protein n=1 Tax=Schistosoma mattheei TaxID=31246 RepID=A0A183PWX2_9TREM|nr:unnamed protein product [Schistosoma mattheei]